MTGKCLLAIIAGCTVVAGTASSKQNEPRTYVLATGSREGVYYKLGEGIKEVVKEVDPNISLDVIATRGSKDNLERLEKGEVHLAFTQSDIADWLVKGEKIRALPSRKQIVAVASLYTELVHIVGRQGLDLERIEDLKGRRVRISSNTRLLRSAMEVLKAAEFKHSDINDLDMKLSDTRKALESTRLFSTAMEVLKAAKFKHSDINDLHMGLTETRKALEKGSIDAAFVTAGTPAPVLQELCKATNAGFIKIRGDVAQTLMKSCPYFVRASIPAGTYGKRQKREIPTVGVRALLVADANVRVLPKEDVKIIAEAIFEHTAKIKEKHEQGGNIRLGSAREGVTLNFHRGAKAYFDEVHSRVVIDRWKKGLGRDIVFSAALIAVFLILYVIVSRAASKVLIFKVSLYFLVFYTFGALTMVLTEGLDGNEHFANLRSSFWSLVVYLTSGFENRDPVTWQGKIASVVIFLVIGVGFSGAVTGKLASIFMKERQRMLGSKRDYIVICNWNERGLGVVEELLRQAAKKHILVIAEQNEAPKELKDSPGYAKTVHYETGDPTSRDVLKAHNVQLAEGVIVLADDQSADPDSKSVLVVLAINKLCGPETDDKNKQAHKNKRPHVVAETHDYRRIQNLKDAGVKEVVCGADLVRGALAQCTLHRQLSEVYTSLLRTSPDTNEIYIIDKADVKPFIGLNFTQCRDALQSSRDPHNPAILLGIRQSKKIFVNPRKAPSAERDMALEQIQEGDALIVMAFHKPDFRRIKIPDSVGSGQLLPES